MSNVKRKYDHKRVWLDPGNPDSMAWAARTEQEYCDPGQQEIQIADCRRVISLQLHIASDARKIRKLIDLLEDALSLYWRFS